ncbi:DUF3710 domain-containing protein [Acidothermaceae bacterium B102]|nr:DUF3710 domain-containing protein [Acidothermaceae bacterium B102]
MFRRRGRDSDEGDETSVDLEAQESADDEIVEVVVEPGRPQGPWDVDDLPDDGQERLDLGGMLVPVSEGMELRVDVSPEGQVIAATVVSGASAMQVNAFAAPRTAGIWAEIADEILESLVESGGSGEIIEGELGLELRAKVPAEGAVLQPARFLGADGPRWFVRALMSGPAATDPVQAAPFEYVFRSVVVVRGKDAMAPRDPLPLRLPTDVLVSGEPGVEEDGDDPLNPFERGPEITEIH